MRFVRLLLLLLYGARTEGLDNGEALTPPMGWRSWNAFGTAIDQPTMVAIMTALSERRRAVDGKLTSLADLGYKSAGLDDGWQACGTGVNGSFHDASGEPLIATDRFPDLKAMTAYAHALGLKAGWYMNNCQCKELACEYASPCWEGAANLARHMERSARAVATYGFDGVKLDGCGQFRNLTWWAGLLNATGRPMVIENCHGPPFPTWPNDTTPGRGGDGPCTGISMPSDCPYSFYRTSTDITNSWPAVYSNLLSTRPFQQQPPLSRPGAWAYPDMLEVGRMATAAEDRSHFGAWCVTSSPLVLGYDLRDASTTDRIWPIIANPEAVAINQAWAGHPGRQAKVWPSGVELWSKPLGGGRLAALLLNPTDANATAALSLADAGLRCAARARDVWARAELGVVRSGGALPAAHLGPHDSAFYTLTPLTPAAGGGVEDGRPAFVRNGGSSLSD